MYILEDIKLTCIIYKFSIKLILTYLYKIKPGFYCGGKMKKRTNTLKLEFIKSYSLFFVIFTAILSILLIFVFNGATRILEKLGAEALKNRINMSVEYLDFLDSQVKNGYITLEDAQETFRTAMLNKIQEDGKTRGLNDNLELGIEAYMYAIDKNGNEMMHPYKEGENISDIVDAKGKNVVQLIVNEGNNPKNGGIITFFWKNPTDKKAREKINAVKYYKSWGWYINVGCYYEDFYGNLKEFFKYLVAFVSIVIIILFVFILYISDKRSKPYSKMTESVSKMAEGDLNADFEHKRNDDVKIVLESLKVLKSKIRNYIELSDSSSETLFEASEELNNSSEYISKSASQISNTVNDFSYDTARQSEYAETADRNMQELSRLILNCKSNMDNVDDNTNEVIKSVDEGTKVINKLMENTETSEISNDRIFSEISQASANALNVEKASSVIISIAAQTRLLALNASIEAAKAGDSGKGFAVVASEIRKLADESQKSSMEIETVVKGLIKNIEALNKIGEEFKDNNKKQYLSINETKDNYERIYQKIKNSDESIKSFNEVIGSLINKEETVLNAIDELSEISKNNSAKIQEINASVEEQTASIEDVNKYSNRLLKLSQDLKESVNKYFRL